MPSTQTSVPDAVDGSHPAVSRMTACGYKATRCGVPSHVRLRLRKRTSEPITAAHNYLFGGNVSFAIRKQTFASVNLNGRCGSTPALRGCHTIERFCDAGEGQPSARNGRSLEPLAMAAYGSESSRSDSAPQTVGFDPQETFRRTLSGLEFHAHSNRPLGRRCPYSFAAFNPSLEKR